MGKWMLYPDGYKAYDYNKGFCHQI
ncbi:hypothetical protein LINPERPRIM_LOCUS22266 [Linum perenne]